MPGDLDFDIKGKLHFREQGLFSRTEPPHSLVPEKELTSAIRTFLHKNTPLQKPDYRNRNIYFRSPGELSGTITLPLWTQNEEFNDRSPRWYEYLRFLDALRPLLEVLGRHFAAVRPREHDAACDRYLEEAWLPAAEKADAARIPGPRPTSGDCFARVRIGANLAPDPAGDDGDGGDDDDDGCSPWKAFTLFGDAKPRLEFLGLEGGLCGPWDLAALRVRRGDVLVVERGVRVGCHAFVGESYLVEAFVG